MSRAPESITTRVRQSIARLHPRVREVSAFAAIGALNMVLNVGLFTLLTVTTTLGAGWSSLISAAITTVLSFVLNRKYAFTSAEDAGLRAFALFILVNVAGIGIETGLVAGAAGVLDIRNALPLDAVKVFAIGVGTVFRYAAYRYLVFPDRATSLPDASRAGQSAPLMGGVLPVRADTD